MIIPRLVVAGTHSGVGKTTVTLALLAALRQRGRLVQPYKAGPDFIDPGHHQAAAGRPSRNLDGWMLGAEVNRALFTRAAAGADIAIIEGMMGLFDSSSPRHDSGSTAEIARQVQAPVLLVIDGSGMARSAAAMASGYAAFNPAVQVRGVLFNRISNDRHYRLLREAVEAETDLAALGYLRPDAAMTIADRHLGLRTALEDGHAEIYDRLGRAAAETVDLDRVEALAQSAPEIEDAGPRPVSVRPATSVRVGVAYDAAFCFYYQDNLDLLEAAGAELVRFSPLHDAVLPDVELLYVGGGYPEIYGAQLAANRAMRQAVRRHAERGGAIYAECGGLMYLTQAIRDGQGARHDMVGLFPADAVMRRTGMTLGYRGITATRPCLFGAAGTALRGHEFHYSILEPSGPLTYVCALTDADGQAAGDDGLCAGRVLALYSHLHFAGDPAVAQHVLEAARG